MSIRARLEFELAYYDVAVQHVSCHVTWTPFDNDNEDNDDDTQKRDNSDVGGKKKTVLKRKGNNRKVSLFFFFFFGLWHIKLCWLFNAESISYNKQFYFIQLSLV